MLRNQEGQLQRLLLIQPRIAEARIVCAEVIRIQRLAAAETLRDGLPRQLEVDAAKIRALLRVDLEGFLQLLQDVLEVARLDARPGGLGIAVHGVALPDDGASVDGIVLDGADVCGQELPDAGGAVAGD